MKIVLLGAALSALMGVVIGTSLNPHLDQPDPSGSYVQTWTVDPVEVAEAAPADTRSTPDPARTDDRPPARSPDASSPPAGMQPRAAPSDEPIPQINRPADADSGAAEPSRPSRVHSNPEQTLYASAAQDEDGEPIDAAEQRPPTLVQYTTSYSGESGASNVGQR